MRSRFLAAAALAFAIAGNVAAQPYPSRPIRLIAPSSPGSGVDFVSRVVAAALTTELGQQVVVDNRAGAGGNIGAEIAATSVPNGYTFMMATPSQIINAILYKNLSYNLLGEFTPITMATSGQFVLITHPSMGVKSVQQFIQLAKSKPGAINYASAGQGNVTHLTMEYFRATTGIDLLHVPYKGDTPALIDLVSGQVHLMFGTAVSFLPYVKAGRLRAVAVTNPQRSPVVPNVPSRIWRPARPAICASSAL